MIFRYFSLLLLRTSLASGSLKEPSGPNAMPADPAAVSQPHQLDRTTMLASHNVQ